MRSNCYMFTLVLAVCVLETATAWPLTPSLGSAAAASDVHCTFKPRPGSAKDDCTDVSPVVRHFLSSLLADSIVAFKCAGARLICGYDQTTMDSLFIPHLQFFPATPMDVAPPAFPQLWAHPSFFPPLFPFSSFMPPLPCPAALFSSGAYEPQTAPPSYNPHPLFQQTHPGDTNGEVSVEADNQCGATPAWAFVLPAEFSGAVQPEPKACRLQPKAAAAHKPKVESAVCTLADAAALELHRLLIARGLQSQLAHLRQGSKSATAVLPDELPCGCGVLLLHPALDRELADAGTPLHRSTFQKLGDVIRQSAGEVNFELWVRFFRSRGKVCAKATVSWKR